MRGASHARHITGSAVASADAGHGIGERHRAALRKPVVKTSDESKISYPKASRRWLCVLCVKTHERIEEGCRRKESRQDRRTEGRGPVAMEGYACVETCSMRKCSCRVEVATCFLRYLPKMQMMFAGGIGAYNRHLSCVVTRAFPIRL